MKDSVSKSLFLKTLFKNGLNSQKRVEFPFHYFPELIKIL